MGNEAVSGVIGKNINVEIVYALPDEQVISTISVPEGTIIKEVLLKSNIFEAYPELDLEVMKVGLFGKLVKMDQSVRDRDRIEIYRPLIADPKEVRKRKAAEGKLLKKGGASASENKK